MSYQFAKMRHYRINIGEKGAQSKPKKSGEM